MLNLQLLEKERARLYKNDLRRQFEQKHEMRKNQSMELRSRDQQELKQKIDVAMKQMRYEKQRDFYLNSKLKQENMMLASLKNMNNEAEESIKQQTPLKGSSLLQTLYRHQDSRGNKAKKIAKKLSQQNHQQESFHKMTNKDIKSHQIIEDQKHMERLKQIQALRRQQYEDIKNRHSPQPKIGQMHKKLQDLNENYKKSLESFAYNGRDILDVLKRDESKQIFERNRRVQSQLKNQIQQKKIKDQISKHDYVGQPDDLKKSILGNMLFKGSNYDKKEYANFLVKQINQTDYRKSTQKIENKQKIEISSIFGGQGGPQRLKMIKYIDKNLGIESDYLRNLEPGNKSNSSYRINNLHEYNGQSLTNQSRRERVNPEERPQQSYAIPQKSYTQTAKINEVQYRKPQSSNENTIRLSSSRIGEQSPKSYLGYDLIKGSQFRYEM